MAAATLTFPSQTLLKNVVDPVDGTDAATKEYVDGKTGSGSVAAAGSNTQIQYNSASTIGASSALTFDYAGNILTIAGNLISNNANLGNLATANYINIANNLQVLGDANIVGNLTVLGSVSYIESTTTYVTDPITEVGGGNAGETLSSNDNMDRGSLLHYYTTKPVDAFIGWDNSNAEFAIAGNVTVLNNVVSYNDFGNVRLGNIFAGNLVNASFFTGDGGLLSNIQATGGSAGTANTANTVTANAQPNITSVGNLLNLTVGNTTPNVYINGNGNATIGGDLSVLGNASFVTLLVGNTSSNVYIDNAGDIDAAGNITLGDGTGGTITGANAIFANFFIGDGSQLTNLPTVHDANYANYANYAYYAGNVTIANQPNITAVGRLTSLVVGNATANSTFGNGTIVLTSAGNITGGNLVSANYITGTLTTASQPNITSVGSLSNLTVTGNIISGNSDLGNLAIANYFSGNGSLLTSLTGTNVTGQVANALIAGTVYTNAQPNITSVGTLLNTIMGSSNSLTGGNLVSANYITGTLTTANQPNVTTVGTLTNLTVSGNISSQTNLSVSGNIHTTDLIVTGNSMLQGNTELQNIVTVTSPTDSTNSSTGALILTLGGLGVYGNINSGMNITGSTITGNLTTASQPNITSLGTLTRLNVSGSANVTTLLVGNTSSNVYIDNAGDIDAAGNITLGDGTGGTITGANAVFANYFIGDGSQLTNLPIVGDANYANYANFAGSVLTNAQPNITSVGTLTSITVSGSSNLGNIIISSGNISNANVVNANTLAASNAITRNGRTVATYVSSTTMPSNPQVGDEWYDQTLHKIYQYIYDGSAYNWIDVSAGYIVANVQVQNGTLVVRDNNGNIYANVVNTGTLSANTLTANTLNVSNIVSKGSGISVSNSTDTLIDRFPKTLYRSAKYIISARNDDGFEVMEALIIHDDGISFIQTYGDVSTGTVADIVSLSSNVVSGNVCLYATGSNSNTFVNLVSTYVTD